MENKLIRITTVPISLKVLLKGQLNFMSQNGFEVLGVSAQGKSLEDVSKSEGVRVACIEMTRVISPVKDLMALYRFYKLCKKEKPQMVHSHTPKAGIVGMLGAKLAGVPIRLHTVAGLPLMESAGLKRKILVWVEKLTYACATRVYPNSKGLYDFIIERGLTPTSKLRIIGNGSSNGIDTSFFNPAEIPEDTIRELRTSLGISKDIFVYVFVGRIVKDKGINELVQAFKGLTTSGCKLLLVGSMESDLDPILPETIREIEQNNNILYVGFQKDVRPYFAISDCLVFPSYREGFPNVVMQAGAMGLPSIVSNINGCNEIIKEGENGIIVPVKDVPSLKSAMLQILKDSTYRKQMSVQARELIKTRYEQQIVWQALLEEYRELLNCQFKN